MNSERPPQMMQKGTHISITVEEYDRLKKLDENVKRELKTLRAQSREKYVEIVEIKISWLEKLLESLDK
jgi:hypothetical protein